MTTKTDHRLFPRYTMGSREAWESDHLTELAVDRKGQPLLDGQPVDTLPADEYRATHYYEVRHGDPVQLCRLARDS